MFGAVSAPNMLWPRRQAGGFFSAGRAGGAACAWAAGCGAGAAGRGAWATGWGAGAAGRGA
jgi:hypothetical protein